MVEVQIDHLPEEILTEIFSRLDAKSVGRCRCLLKKWRSHLSTSQFINLHLSRKIKKQENLIFISYSTLHTIFAPITYDVTSTKVETPNTKCTRVLGSCNGLVLLETLEDDMLLVNPVTQQQVKIQNFTLTLNEHDGKKLRRFAFVAGDDPVSIRGFGYDSSSDDYKIVTLSYYVTENGPRCIYAVIDVYYLKRAVWKRIGPYYQSDPVLLNSYGAFVNGSIHWLSSNRASDYPSKIVAFVLKDEILREVPAPADVYDGKFDDGNRLFVFEGCLCMVDDDTNIWVMKKYGLGDSWAKWEVRPSSNWTWDVYALWGFIGDEEKEIVLLTDTCSIVAYSLQTATTRELSVDECLPFLYEGGTFVDSLVSPSQNV